MHLTYARKMYEGHIGARRFWRTCLPRLKYYNPAVGISVKQTDDQEKPPLLTIYFAQNKDKASTPANVKMEDTLAPAPNESETVKTIDLRGQQVSEIWEKVKAATGAKELEASEADLKEIEENKKLDEKSEVDRQRVAAIRKARKDQEKMLQSAREEVERQRAEQ